MDLVLSSAKIVISWLDEVFPAPFQSDKVPEKLGSAPKSEFEEFGKKRISSL